MRLSDDGLNKTNEWKEKQMRSILEKIWQSFVEKYGDGDGERWFKEDFTILSLIEDHVIDAL